MFDMERIEYFFSELNGYTVRYVVLEHQTEHEFDLDVYWQDSDLCIDNMHTTFIITRDGDIIIKSRGRSNTIKIGQNELDIMLWIMFAIVGQTSKLEEHYLQVLWSGELIDTMLISLRAHTFYSKFEGICSDLIDHSKNIFYNIKAKVV